MRAAVFIDHRNLVTPILDQYEINYKKLQDILLKNFEDSGVFLFMGVIEPISKKKQKFLKYLEALGIIVFTTALVRRRNGTYEQKQVDMLMHEYITTKAEIDDLDTAILVTGDSDFVLSAMLVKNMDKDVIVWSWRDSLAMQLKETVGEMNVCYIDDVWHEIRKKR